MNVFEKLSKKNQLHTQDNELRTRLLVSYKIPDLKLTPYVATGIFTWGNTWRKSRHYAVCTYDVTDYMQAEGFYMLTFSDKDPQHILDMLKRCHYFTIKKGIK